tara:strand:+ start:343 stop:633 length:291 start_codon:yes stop_codon:yes gene_type:complete
MNESTKKTLFNLGASSDIISVLVLLFATFQDAFKHITVSTSMLIFSIIKIVGKSMQAPYYFDKTNAYIKNSINIGLYSIIAIIQAYTIYKHYYSHA